MRKSKKMVWLALSIVLAMVIAGCGGGGGSTTVQKAEVKFPTKPINLIVPYAPGGSSDLSARPVSDQLGSVLGQPMVVVNKPGAGGSVGAAEVARARGDGYTLLNASIGNVTIMPVTSKVGYDHKSFKAVAQLTDIPLALAVSKDAPFKDLKEFVEYAKANPNKVRYGTPGAGNIQHVAMESFSKNNKIALKQMPFEGANPAVAALLGGHVEATCTGTSEVVGHYKSGTIKILGVTGEKRLDDMPDVPTFKEQGFNEVFGVWYGIIAPKDTPDDIVAKLAEASKKASDDPKVIDAWKKLYLIPAYLGPKDFDARIQKDAETIRKILEDIGLASK